MRRLIALWLIVVVGVIGVGSAYGESPKRADLKAALNFDALQPGQQAAVAVVLDIAPGFHAQSHQTRDENLVKYEVTLEDDARFAARRPLYPKGEEVEYPSLGKLNVYTGRVIVYVPIEVKRDAPLGEAAIRGKVVYQICDDKACYRPERPGFEVRTRIVPAGEAVRPANAELFTGFDPSVFAQGAEAARRETSIALLGWKFGLADDAYVLAFFLAFVVGIIFNLMPCVLPVVPLKAMGFYEVSRHHRGRSLALGAVFSAGLVASFGVLALLVVVLRKLSWGEMYSNPWFLGGIVVILLVMGLGMLGAFNVILPAGVYRLTPRHDTYTGNFLFGILTALLSTPCTAPMFLGLLIWATKQPVELGVALVMTVGVGMASPYLMLSGMPEVARRFPRTGPWAELLKQMMAFLLFAVAVYFARRFIGAWIGDKAYWWTLFAVVLAAGVFLVVRTVQFSRGWVGPVAAAVVALALVGPALAVTWRVTNPPIAWQPYSPAALEEARATGRPVLVEFTADWCGNCLALEATVFHDPATVEAIRRHGVITLKADVTREDAEGWKLLRELNPVGAIPLTAVYGAKQVVQLSGIYTTGNLVAAVEEAGRTRPQSSVVRGP